MISSTSGNQSENTPLGNQATHSVSVESPTQITLVNSPAEPTSGLYISIYMKNMYRLKRGHFVVGVELITHLYLKLRSKGCIIRDIGIKGSRVRPDLAVGEKFHKYLVENKIDVFNKFSYDKFLDEKNQEFKVRQYQLELLPVFHKYFENIWMVEESGKYFKSREPNCIQYLLGN